MTMILDERRMSFYELNKSLGLIRGFYFPSIFERVRMGHRLYQE